VIGEPVDTLGGAKGEDKARAFELYGCAFMACRPPETSDWTRRSIHGVARSSVCPDPARH